MPCDLDDGSATCYRHTPDSGLAIQDVVDRLGPGDRLMLSAGVYRESVCVRQSGRPEAPIVIKAETPGAVVITGTEIVTDWSETKAGSGVWKTVVDLSDLEPAPKYGLLAGRCEQVFVDGQALRQVLHPDQLQGGTFCYEREQCLLLIMPQVFSGELTGGKQAIEAGGITGGGTVEMDRSSPENCWQFITVPFHPANHLIEVSRRSKIFSTTDNVSHVVISGFTFRGSADLPQQAMARFCGSDLLIEDCLFEAGAARGFDLRARHSTVRRCVSRLNGQMGFSGYGTHNLVEDCALLYNNTKHSDFTCFEQGGCKICRTDHWTLRRIRCVGNDGPGLWFDIDNTNAVIEQCWCEGNSGPGIMYEISSDADIRNNVCFRNGFAYGKDVRFDSIHNSVGHVEPIYGQGILVQMARRVRVINNTCVENRRCGIELRHHPYQQAGNPRHSIEAYRLEDNEVFNNVLADNGWDNLMVSEPPANPTKKDEVRRNRHDHNLFFMRDVLRQFGGNLLAFCRWGKTQAAGSMSLEEWRAARHQDLHSIQWDPMFVSPLEGDFRLEIGSPAAGSGRVTPELKDDYLGRARPSGKPAIGAFEPVVLTAAGLLRK